MSVTTFCGGCGGFIFTRDQYTVHKMKNTSYYARVHQKTPEWHCFGINTPGTYEISCDSNGTISFVEKDPPPRTEGEKNEGK